MKHFFSSVLSIGSIVELTEVSYNTWIKPLEPYSIDANTIMILAPSEFHKGIINARYFKLLKTAFLHVTDEEFHIHIIAEDDIV